jgi:fructokinase
MLDATSMSNIGIAVAGEALIDLIGRPDGTFLPFIGGAPYNLARALARQNVGTMYLNPLSADRFGRMLAKELQTDGVNLACDVPVPQTTALAIVSLDDLGHPNYAFYREGVADREVTASGLNHACNMKPGLKMVCTGALALDPRDASVYLPWLEAQRIAGRYVVVDANLRPSVMSNLSSYRRNVLSTLAMADLIKVSDEDLMHLGWGGVEPIRAARELLLQTKATLLVLTMGAAGAWLLTPEFQYYAREADELLIVDTVGAGDCFLAGFLAALMKLTVQAVSPQEVLCGLSESEFRGLLRHALASASLCVQQQGCVPPSWQETTQWSQKRSVVTD